MTNIRVERVLNVPKSYIWSIVGSYDKSPSKSYDLEITKIGDPENDGIGTERILHSGKRKVYERIVGVWKMFSIHQVLNLIFKTGGKQNV